MKRIFQGAAMALLCLAGQAFAQDLTPVTIGWGPYPDVPQFAQAVDKKLWTTEKLAAKVVPFTSGRAGFEALIGGQLDYVVMAEFPAVAGVMRNLKFSIVAVLSEYRSFRVITKGDKPLAGLKALAGKKIAIPLGTNVHYIVADALAAQGVSAELVNVPPPEMATTLSRGDVDAIMTFPGGYANARRALGAQYQEIRLPGYAGAFVLAASEKASANPALTQRVLATLLKGEELVTSNPAESQEATARYVGGAIPVEAIRATWGDYEYRIKLDAGTLDLMVKEGQWLKAKGLVKDGEPSTALYRKAFAPAPLGALAPARVTLP
jgi:ABC-type nitrate/sulfonate/bicarbonate transport system substrate-binding protein